MPTNIMPRGKILIMYVDESRMIGENSHLPLLRPCTCRTFVVLCLKRMGQFLMGNKNNQHILN